MSSETKLESVIVIARHGLRTPFSPFPKDKSFEWRCKSSNSEMQNFINHFSLEKVLKIDDNGQPQQSERIFPHNHSNQTEMAKERPLLPTGDCYGGQLTYQGFLQMADVGLQFHNRYVKSDNNPNGIIDPHYQNSQFYIRSTVSKRAIESAQAVLFGMFANPKSLKQKPITSDEIVIHVLDRKLENMYPRSTCKRLSQLRRKIRESAEYQKREQQFKSDLAHVVHPDLQDRIMRSNWAGLENSVHSLERHAFPLPDIDNAARSVIEEAAGWAGEKMNQDPEIIRLGIGRFINDLVHTMDKTANRIEQGTTVAAKPLRFAYFSGHDNTLFPFLNAFQVYDGRHPPMGSHIELEMYSQQSPRSANRQSFVRFLYNNKEFQIPECKKQQKLVQLQAGSEPVALCPYETFRSIAKRFVPKDYEEECKL